MAKIISVFYVVLLSLSLIDLSVAVRKPVGFYKLSNGKISITVTNWGATVQSVIVPDKQGGHRGFSDVIWTVLEHVKDGSSPYITLYYRSFDGEQGFPGDLDVFVTYALAGNSLSISMKAKALSKATPVNLAHHGYWNLGGHNSGNILNNTIKIYGSKITPVDDELIPTGKFLSVKGTPFDFLEANTIGSRIGELSAGYDINYVIDGAEEQFKKVAEVYDGKSGRFMELWADKPGVQFYTGNMLGGEKGKDGAVYGAHAGLCLETQGFPDAVNHPNFPSQIVNPGDEYKHFMLYNGSSSSSSGAPGQSGDEESGQWCVARPSVPFKTLQEAMDYACGEGGADWDDDGDDEDDDGDDDDDDGGGEEETGWHGRGDGMVEKTG
ncbi:hypothetical protein Sjap_024861 [Stephania japonica]|uniref:Aldose 1-epimerase n=1 Tax=Stephania japonica TaxID=461633 RepID=A0AAP0EEB5_9MAGN